MTLSTILLITFIVAIVLTVIIRAASNKGMHNILVSFLQNFCGFLFIFSGGVKAVDPLGTAYKMGDYFKQFQVHLSWFEGLFKWMDGFTPTIAVGMIVLEIVLGVMLIMGMWRRFTAWTFFLLIFVFTFLTGFTYLTGYVPRGATFFELSKWDSWVESNMLVTDCGCFGDFIKLEPYVSFLKDVFLLIPALVFIFVPKKMHQIFSTPGRFIIGALSTFGLIIYCLSNFVWDIPHPSTDFRPFNVGKNIREAKQMEEDAQANVQVLGFSLTNKASGEKVDLTMDEFTKRYKEFPKEEWEYEQNKTEPTMKSTKISEIEFSLNDADIAPSILQDPSYTLVFIGHKAKYTRDTEKVIKRDTIFTYDTVAVAKFKDSVIITKNIEEVKSTEVDGSVVNFTPEYMEQLQTVGNLADKAEIDGFKAYFITKYDDPDVIEAFGSKGKFHHPVAVADELLLKTIIRSNPGLVLFKDGTIVNKWHYNKLPSYEVLKSDYLK